MKKIWIYLKSDIYNQTKELIFFVKKKRLILFSYCYYFQKTTFKFLLYTLIYLLNRPGHLNVEVEIGCTELSF
jgi:hypothetical protein